MSDEKCKTKQQGVTENRQTPEQRRLRLQQDGQVERYSNMGGEIASNECLKCGHCCRTMILEPDEIDVEREPRILEYAEKLKQPYFVDSTGRWDNQYLLPSPCPFLLDDKCSIYPTRPNMCVVFEAGKEMHCALTVTAGGAF